MATKTTHVGGSFAPPLTDELLTQYAQLADSAPEEIRDAMRTLHRCALAWWEQPESTGGKERPHPSGRGVIVPLDEPIAVALYDAIPWTRELDSMAALFETIDAVCQWDLRNAAHHLLWFARELDLDREPITNDKL